MWLTQVHKSKYWEYVFEDSMHLIAKLPVVAAAIYRNIYKASSVSKIEIEFCKCRLDLGTIWYCFVKHWCYTFLDIGNKYSSSSVRNESINLYVYISIVHL